MRSSTPVTVTFCGADQFCAVNSNALGLTVPSPVSLLEIPMLTFDFGSECSTTVKEAVVPSSLVLPVMAETVMPALSLSLFEASTSGGSQVLYLPSLLIAGSVKMV